jgi:hypothetical protein
MSGQRKKNVATSVFAPKKNNFKPTAWLLTSFNDLIFQNFLLLSTTVKFAFMIARRLSAC